MANFALAEEVNDETDIPANLSAVASGGVTHAGIVFPDVLLARWALFFDDLSVPWRFRPVSFVLGSGTRYVPDFWLPELHTWFQVADDRDDYWFDDLQRWREFALAADPHGTYTEELSRMGANSDEELAELDEEELDLALYAKTRLPLPPPWDAREALYSAGGIPDPHSMQEYGPEPNPSGSMRILGDGGYQWTRCPSCGHVGAEFNGRADRLGCGHGDPINDKNYQSNDPHLLRAYALARRATAARFDGTCARCELAFERHTLVLRGRPVGRRNWYHATCWRPANAPEGTETSPIEPSRGNSGQ